MTETSSSRGASPPLTNSLQQDYDITRMREDDFERLAVYIVPDVPCERGSSNRAERTLPRSLTLKASIALSTPSHPVGHLVLRFRLNLILYYFIRLMEYGRQESFQKAHDLVPLKDFVLQAIPVTNPHGDTSGG